MTTTKHNRNLPERTEEDDAKIIELGSEPSAVTPIEPIGEWSSCYRTWPNETNAQAWCDYMLAKGPEICTSAEIVPDPV